MDGTRRRAENSLAERIATCGHEFDFFQAVRILQRVFPDRKPTGGPFKPRDEAVRFRSRVTLEFPASAIHEIRKNGGESPAEMTVSFMGLMGTQGVLPFHYTEWMIQRELHKDTAMAAFFDLFNHRWISLFYKAWEKHRMPVAFERRELNQKLGQKSGGRIYQCVFDIAGYGTEGLRNRLRVADSTFAYYAGLIAQRSRSASALRGLLQDYFDVPCEIVQFQGAWYRLDDSDRCYLGAPGIHNQVGKGAVLGDAVWNAQSGFEVRIGPLGYETFRSFLPDGRAAGELGDIVRMFAGATAAFRLRLILLKTEIPSARLSGDEASPRLGWDLWLADPSRTTDAGEAEFAEAA